MTDILRGVQCYPVQHLLSLRSAFELERRCLRHDMHVRRGQLVHESLPRLQGWLYLGWRSEDRPDDACYSKQFTPDIARGLREHKHDVVAVCERSDLLSSEDETLLALSSAKGRALLTNNVRDFAPIATRWAGDGRIHHGLLFVSDRTLDRSRNTLGAYVSALEAFMKEHPGEDALRDQVRWLTVESSE